MKVAPGSHYSLPVGHVYESR